jgi:arsenate reductase (glutaredoxin)
MPPMLPLTRELAREVSVSTVTIYHNPACQKSQEALEYLESRGYLPRVIHYLETPLAESEVRLLVRQLGISPSSLIRAPDFQRLGLVPTSNPDQLIALIVKHPILLQRPIVVVGDCARIAKPPEVLAGMLPLLDFDEVTPE